ncbi:MAG: hypothetical protein IT299_08350 [Dehalococcoidia bacterium]|nr:hypothetical protein [Dehalococcoidia bacterium]
MARYSAAAYQEAYEEVVATGWMLVVTLVPAAISGAIAVAMLRDPTISSGERLGGMAAVLVAGFITGVTGVIFSRLRVRVDSQGVRFGFGPFRSTVRPDEIEGASESRYRWSRFGGWGIRWAWNMKDRAYSVPFVRRGVEIRLRNGRTYFVSSRRPDALARAIEGLTGRSATAAL